MEKFSAFRDPATGLAPFVTPVPPSTNFPPLLYALYPVLTVLSLLRTIALFVLLAASWLVSCLILPLVRS